MSERCQRLPDPGHPCWLSTRFFLVEEVTHILRRTRNCSESFDQLRRTVRR